MRINRFNRILLLALVGLQVMGCSRDENSFRSLNLSVSDNVFEEVVIESEILVVGDVNSPQIANFLETRGYEVTDVPYVAYEAAEVQIDGDYIVWSDNRNGNRDIYAYQISTATEFVVSTAAGIQRLPQVSGDYIVWEDHRNGNADIYAYQISSATEIAIATDESAQTEPRIDGDYIVWQDQRNGLADIYAYRISSQEELVISTQAGEQWAPKIAGDYIVWQSYLNGFSDIYGYQVSSATLFPISTAVGSQYQPVMSEKYVVWLDNSVGDDNLYAYNLETQQEIIVSNAAGQQWRPQVRGEYVVWQDFRDGNYDIYAYHFGSQTETVVSADAAQQSHPVLTDDLIIWQDFRNGHYDIYTYQISSGTETRLSQHSTPQTRPLADGNRLVWLDAKRGVVDVMMRDGISGEDLLVTNTWVTPAGIANADSGLTITDYDVAILGSDVLSNEIMLDVFDAADAANVSVLGFGGTGMSLAAALAADGRYGIQVTPDSGCSEMQVFTTALITETHPLAFELDVEGVLKLEQEAAEGMDELAINTDANATDSPQDWAVLATFHDHMCNEFDSAIVEFTTDAGTHVLLDGSATVADKYRYWTNDRWKLLTNELTHLR